MPKSRFGKKKVLVAMSGGVDSSVAAALLKKQGYEVTGGFIKNWSDTKDIWTGECSWKEERRDAMRVAAKIGIPLMTFDFEKIYKAKVVENLFKGYGAGETPNPDILCNEVIKFGAFFEQAQKLGMEYMATGHYARIDNDAFGTAHLKRGKDNEKDQSYFLYRVPQHVLRQTIFPIGNLSKASVRKLAKRLKLATAEKPDSQGICFIGKLNMGQFLRKKIQAKPGKIYDFEGNLLGEHDGLDQFTIGQRHGLRISKGEQAWYVAKKDIKNNSIIIVPGENHPALYAQKIFVNNVVWTNGQDPKLPIKANIQVRYRQKAMAAIIKSSTISGIIEVDFLEPVKFIAIGQSAVFYQKMECIGGGFISL